MPMFRRCVIRLVGLSSLLVATACAPERAGADPVACPSTPPCTPAACTPIGTHCEYYVNRGSQATQLCDCVVAPDGGLAEGVWQCGGC